MASSVDIVHKTETMIHSLDELAILANQKIGEVQHGFVLGSFTHILGKLSRNTEDFATFPPMPPTHQKKSPILSLLSPKKIPRQPLNKTKQLLKSKKNWFFGPETVKIDHIDHVTEVIEADITQ